MIMMDDTPMLMHCGCGMQPNEIKKNKNTIFIMLASERAASEHTFKSFGDLVPLFSHETLEAELPAAVVIGGEESQICSK